ncbi:hypothetical protein K2173_004708 [Erythroxylum novogranatense]|uniref:rRNA-processing protein FYV7 n=1 Tax=Erythroxylum novogranatense TaxID=1862640 RepID=A0AAV8U9F3_9ROSI|nr:hypothetical protein K2173_004708 [Erythroxylum novogranatense]
MKNRRPKEEEASRGKIEGSKSMNVKKKKKNMMRLGGSGLSLEAFANAKSKNNNYNPALIKKQREFYKNAKYVSKFKKQLKQQSHLNDAISAARPPEYENQTGETSELVKRSKTNKKPHCLRELYEKQREEQQKARIEKETILKAKREEREKAEVQRKEAREKMLKKTRHGQPVMKYRIEQLLQNIQSLK